MATKTLNDLCGQGIELQARIQRKFYQMVFPPTPLVPDLKRLEIFLNNLEAVLSKDTLDLFSDIKK